MAFKKKPTWVSSVPMKMRRIRVRSLLAGCISCLRCVWTSGLSHADPSPLCVPPHSSPFLPALFFCVQFFDSFLNYDFIPQQPCSRKRQICFAESSLCIFISYREPIFGASPLGLRGRTFLFLAATDCDEHWAKDDQTLSYTRL